MSKYPEETLGEWHDDDTMPDNVETLRNAVVGHRIVTAEKQMVEHDWRTGEYTVEAFVITLDNGKQVELQNTSDCCAYTWLTDFLLDPEGVDHVIMGVGTTGEYTTWHIYADWGDILKLEVDWSSGNPFYYGYGFDIKVKEVDQ